MRDSKLSEHVKQIKKSKAKLISPAGTNILKFRIEVPTDEDLILSWAIHFRKQYCDDDELASLMDGTNKTKSEFLEEIIFPSASGAPGPSIRSGDFTEVLLSDYLEFTKNFWVPRNRFQFKATRNESVKGSDIIAIKYKINGQTNPDDILAIFESKGSLSQKKKKTLQDAIDHSGKDYLRVAHTLNAIKRRFLQCGEQEKAEKIKRFQNLEDNPFQEIFGAVAFCTTESIDDPDFIQVDESNHPKKDDLYLMVFHGKDLMKFVHKLYRTAINESG